MSGQAKAVVSSEAAPPSDLSALYRLASAASAHDDFVYLRQETLRILPTIISQVAADKAKIAELEREIEDTTNAIVEADEADHCEG